MQGFLTDIGQFTLLLAFGLSCYSLLASLLAGKVGHRRLASTGERAAVAAVSYTMVPLTTES